ncbi:MAG: SDR family oxidoreductase [Deltaproteobacteria bacterium]|nr:SDR family oxidoreductase [Deltaproteobacteria bacterium]
MFGEVFKGPRWALILGVSSGFGASAAIALAKDGWNIAGVHLDRRATLPNAEAVKAAVEAEGREALFFNSNAADPDKRAAVCDQIAAHLAEGGGKVQCLMHSLAFGSLLPFVASEGKTVTRKQMDMTLDVMANSLVYWVQDVMTRELMASGGRIFAMTSSGARQISPSYGVVSAAKSALESHIRQLAYELLPLGITANSICAGVTKTAALLKIPGHEVLIGKSVAKSPIDRLTETDDVGGAIAALCDPRLYWMTGNVLGIHGGEEIIG